MKVIVECQKHTDYQTSIQWFLTALSTYLTHSRTLATTGAGSAANAASADPALQQATAELRELLERFANGRSMKGMLGAMEVLADDARKDEELREWFSEMDRFIRKVRFSFSTMF